MFSGRVLKALRKPMTSHEIQKRGSKKGRCFLSRSLQRTLKNICGFGLCQFHFRSHPFLVEKFPRAPRECLGISLQKNSFLNICNYFPCISSLLAEIPLFWSSTKLFELQFSVWKTLALNSGESSSLSFTTGGKWLHGFAEHSIAHPRHMEIYVDPL